MVSGPFREPRRNTSISCPRPLQAAADPCSRRNFAVNHPARARRQEKVADFQATLLRSSVDPGHGITCQRFILLTVTQEDQAPPPTTLLFTGNPRNSRRYNHHRENFWPSCRSPAPSPATEPLCSCSPLPGHSIWVVFTDLFCRNSRRRRCQVAPYLLSN